MNKMIKFPLILALTGTICATALGVVYQIANPIIEERVNAAANAAIGSVIEGGKGSDITKKFADKKDLLSKYNISTIYEVKDSSDKKLGHGFKLKGKGRNGDIETLVILNEEKVLGVKVLAQGETSTYYDKVIAAKYEDKFKDQKVENLDKMDTVTGATLSSKGIKGAVINARDAYKEIILGETVGPKELVTAEEFAKLGYTGETFVDATEEFKAIQGKKYENAFLANGFGISNAYYRKNSSGNIIGYVYYFDTSYVYEGAKQNHRCLFSFDKGGKNTKLVVLESTDSLSSDGKPSLTEMPEFINAFNGKTLTEIVSTPVDKVSGATFTTKAVINPINVICSSHKDF